MNTDKSQILNKSIKTRPTIGLLIENTSDIGEGYLTGILTGITNAASAQEVNLMCFVGGALHGVPDLEFDDQRNILYRMIAASNMDGLIIISSIGNYTPQEEMEKLYGHYLPLPTVTIGTPIEGALRVRVDHGKGVTEMLVHLIEVHNYQRIAFIRGPEDSPEAERRYAIYKDILAQYDIPFDPDLVAPGFFRFPSGAAAIELLLDERHVEFDVVMGANDHMALGALEALQARGFVVPYDVAVVGFDNIGQTRNTVPPLTTVRLPLFESGETAVNTIVAKLANETVADELFLSAELVIRRSCGCLSPTVLPVVTQATFNAAESLAQFQTTYRDALIADLIQLLDFSGLKAQEGAAQLVDSFFEEIGDHANGRFISTIDKLLRVVASADGDIVTWQAIIAIIRHHVMVNLRHDNSFLRAGNLLHEAMVFIAGEVRNVEAQHFLRIERQNWILHEIGQLLITMFDLQGLMDVIAENMPRLGIPSCHLVLYENPQPYSYPQDPPEWSRLVLTCDENGRIPIEPTNERFQTRHLLPPTFLPQNRRYTMMVESLYFRNEQIGYLLIERGPREGNVYEVLRGQIASALKGALLLQAHKHAEMELRQHRDHLDDLVQEKTAELATTNQHLRQEIWERQRIEVALRESEENLHATLHSIGDAVIATDTESHIIRMNPVAEQLTGWTFTEAAGKPLTEVFHIINAHTGETAVNPVKKVLESGEIIGLANHTTLIAKNTTTYQIADSAAPIRDSNNIISGVVLVFRDVTEEYRIQEALQERETQLRTLIETIPDLIWLKDPDGVFLMCNSKMERVYGEKEAKIIGKTDYDFVDKQSADDFRQKDMEAIAAGKPIINEETITYMDDGHQATIETIKTPVFDAEGKLIGVLGIARDISARKHREEDLRESKQMLSNVLNTIPVRVFWKDLDGNFLGCNQLFAQDVGKNSPDEVVGINDFSLSSVDQAELYRSDDRDVIENERQKINYEEPQTTPEGTLAWLNTSKIPLRNSNGKIFGVLGTYEDITERKRAEYLLTESNGRLQLALQAASMGTWEWEIVKNHMVWSPEVFNIFDIQTDDFGGTYEDYLAYIAPESRQKVDEVVKQFVQASSNASVIQFEHEIIRGDVKSGWVEMRGALFLDERGQSGRILGVCTDVTARKKVDIQLKMYTAELERSNRELQEFAYVASHDLQEPLRKIQAFGDRLQQKYQADLDEKGLHYIDRMQNAASRMQSLIIDLLAFSRVRTHTQPFTKVDLSEIVKYVLQDLEIAIVEAGAEIVVSKLPILEADALQMHQLFQNLLGNALKFHHLNVPLKITVTHHMIGTYCEIMVADNGIGFDEQYAERIFNVFERLHNREAYAGTGVGLAICRRITERHGGDIRAQSKLGEGATFIIRLPITQPAEHYFNE